MSINKLKQFLPIIFFVSIGLLIYSFNLNSKLFWDDDDWIINNPYIHSLSWDNVKFWFTHNTLAGVGLKSNYYRPFLFFTFAINYVISGIKPLSYHIFSNLIHILNAVLIFFLLSKVRPWSNLRSNLGMAVAFLASLIFLIHPVQTEAVAYISGRGDSLVVLFMLLALVLFLRFRKSGSYLIYDLSLASLALALLSRETAIIFPPLFMVFYIAFIAKSRFLLALKESFVKALPYFGLVAVYGILRLTVLNFSNTLNFYAVPNVYSSSLYVRMLTFLKVLLSYLKIIFVPVGLHMERGMDPVLSPWNWQVWLALVGIASLIVWLVFLYRKERQHVGQEILNHKENWKLPARLAFGNSKAGGELGILDFPKISDFRVWFFGLGWFFIGLAPVSGITPINALIYEHWLYLPIVGIGLIASFYLVKLFSYLQGSTFLKIQGRTLKIVVLATCYLLLATYFAFFAYQSIQRNIIWGNPVQFYEDILKYEPDSVRINNNLGNLYFNQGDTKKAEEYYWKAVEVEDAFPQPHFNLGSILQSKGDIYGAIQEYEKALSLDPNFPYAYQNLIGIYVKQGNLVKALAYAQKLVEILPNNSRVLYNAALISAASNKMSQARQYAEQGLLLVGQDKELEQAFLKLLSNLK